VKQLQAFRNSRFTEAGRQPPLLDAQAIGLLRKHFVSNFELPPSRALSYRGAKAALGKFTNTQLDFLLDSNPARDRLLIEGVAGSGKTLLAMKMAREAAANGDRVLFCCFNKLLSGALREAFSDCSLIEVIRSDQLYWRLAAQVGDQQAQRLQEIESADERWLFFTELLEHPEAHQQPVFDYAVFDEAQDYLEPAFQELMSVILRGGVQAGRWSFFLDSDGQGGVYRNLDKEVLQNLTSAATRQYALTLNCRNTLEVAAGCAAVCQTHLNARVDGGHFKSLFVTSATEFAEAATYARKLIDGGDFQPGQITILVLNQIHLEKMTEAMQAQDLKVCLVEENNSSAVIKSESITITLSTCSAFKGLENDCILVVGGVDPNGDREWVQAVKYAGCSRARLHLAVCIPKSQKQSVETTYRENEAAMQKDMDAKSLDW
jgi:DNA helicase IV